MESTLPQKCDISVANNVGHIVRFFIFILTFYMTKNVCIPNQQLAAILGFRIPGFLPDFFLRLEKHRILLPTFAGQYLYVFRTPSLMYTTVKFVLFSEKQSSQTFLKILKFQWIFLQEQLNLNENVLIFYTSDVDPDLVGSGFIWVRESRGIKSQIK